MQKKKADVGRSRLLGIKGFGQAIEHLGKFERMLQMRWQESLRGEERGCAE